eukprot:TRINITY_DN909_c3_g2_i2.p1 TRINITY_DN909_c3_g2~~TRINITY_DN909_c3_g2_i2.p1  ORF type:complete len:830 (+),score=170.33 TRINITY_DN909_c3_g2_i2:350-2491(+)
MPSPSRTFTATVSVPSRTVTVTRTLSVPSATATTTVSVSVPTVTRTGTWTPSLPTATATVTVTVSLPTATRTQTSTETVPSRTESVTASVTLATLTRSRSSTPTLPTPSGTETVSWTLPTSSLSFTPTWTLPTPTPSGSRTASLSLTGSLPSATRTLTASQTPTDTPTLQFLPTASPTQAPSAAPVVRPTAAPTARPSRSPSVPPTRTPTAGPDQGDLPLEDARQRIVQWASSGPRRIGGFLVLTVWAFGSQAGCRAHATRSGWLSCGLVLEGSVSYLPVGYTAEFTLAVASLLRVAAARIHNVAFADGSVVATWDVQNSPATLAPTLANPLPSTPVPNTPTPARDTPVPDTAAPPASTAVPGTPAPPSVVGTHTVGYQETSGNGVVTRAFAATSPQGVTAEAGDAIQWSIPGGVEQVSGPGCTSAAPSGGGACPGGLDLVSTAVLNTAGSYVFRSEADPSQTMSVSVSALSGSTRAHTIGSTTPLGGAADFASSSLSATAGDTVLWSIPGGVEQVAGPGCTAAAPSGSGACPGGFNLATQSVLSAPGTYVVRSEADPSQLMTIAVGSVRTPLPPTPSPPAATPVPDTPSPAADTPVPDTPTPGGGATARPTQLTPLPVTVPAQPPNADDDSSFADMWWVFVLVAVVLVAILAAVCYFACRPRAPTFADVERSALRSRILQYDAEVQQYYARERHPGTPTLGPAPGYQPPSPN